ncbi:hypothetical protein JTB14_022572 [Gonioctena quinquepunctata]|nr:hypothetical protein JTB14_022572 [Gonioctena quinquepunctata]
MHIRGTGGGPPLPEKDKHPTDDLLLSIINEKTVCGMNPPFGGDVDSESEDEVQNAADGLTTIINDKIELIYDQSSKPDSSIYNMELELVNTPELESTEPSTSISTTSQENIQKNKTWASYTPSDLLEKVSSPLKRKISKVLSHSQQENIPGPSTIEKTPKKTSRRRPAIVVKSLTSSDIAAKYDKLLDCRLEIVAYTKKELEQRIQQNVIKVLLLDIQLEIEREKLQKIKRSDYL